MLEVEEIIDEYQLRGAPQERRAREVIASSSLEDGEKLTILQRLSVSAAQWREAFIAVTTLPDDPPIVQAIESARTALNDHYTIGYGAEDPDAVITALEQAIDAIRASEPTKRKG